MTDTRSPSSSAVRDTSSTKRNDPCPCGSLKKYKKCHGKDEAGAGATGPVTDPSSSPVATAAAVHAMANLVLDPNIDDASDGTPSSAHGNSTSDVSIRAPEEAVADASVENASLREARVAAGGCESPAAAAEPVRLPARAPPGPPPPPPRKAATKPDERPEAVEAARAPRSQSITAALPPTKSRPTTSALLHGSSQGIPEAVPQSATAKWYEEGDHLSTVVSGPQARHALRSTEPSRNRIPWWTASAAVAVAVVSVVWARGAVQDANRELARLRTTANLSACAPASAPSAAVASGAHADARADGALPLSGRPTATDGVTEAGSLVSGRPIAAAGADQARSAKPTVALPREDQPAVVRPLVDQLPAKKPSAEKPTAERPTAESTADRPTADRPTADKPTAEKPTAEKPTAEKPTAEKPTAEKPTAAAKPAVQLIVSSTPAGAFITTSTGRTLGTTPLITKMPRGEQVVIDFKMPGMAAASRVITPTADATLSVTLQPLPP